jgi:hypothetical protein
MESWEKTLFSSLSENTSLREAISRKPRRRVPAAPPGDGRLPLGYLDRSVGSQARPEPPSAFQSSDLQCHELTLPLTHLSKFPYTPPNKKQVLNISPPLTGMILSKMILAHPRCTTPLMRGSIGEVELGTTTTRERLTERDVHLFNV